MSKTIGTDQLSGINKIKPLRNKKVAKVEVCPICQCVIADDNFDQSVREKLQANEQVHVCMTNKEDILQEALRRLRES